MEGRKFYRLNTIEGYLTNSLNIRIFKEIPSFISEDSLKFFNQLYDHYYYFIDNDTNFKAIYDVYDVRELRDSHHSRFNYQKPDIDSFYSEIYNCVFGCHLCTSLKMLLLEFYKGQNVTDLQSVCLKMIDDYLEAYSRIYLTLLDIVDDKDDIDNFEDVLVRLDDLTDYDEKVDFLHYIKYKFIENRSLFVDQDIDYRCDIELLKLKALDGFYLDSQTLPNETLQSNLHNNIFIGSAFNVWESLLEEFDIKKNSVTDISFIYQVKKKDGYIHNNIGPKDMIGWINGTYENLDFTQFKYIDLNADSNKKRWSLYNTVTKSR